MSMSLWLLSILGWPAPLIAQTRPVCRPADGATARVAQQLRRDMMDPSQLGQDRRRLTHLPAGNNVAIAVVTDEQICRKARAAYIADTRSYNRITGEWNTPASRVYVLQVDTLYYVWNPGTRMGEWELASTLDARFNTVARVMQ
jgi:hypothetical protein